MVTFEELGLPAGLCDAARAAGWESPTPVQVSAVPAGMSGSDIKVRAQTGTGKTGAYAFVLLSITSPGSQNPTSIVIAPTRELAMQVDTEIRRLAKGSGHTCVPVYGGADISNQIRQLRRGADIVIGTPGRLRDLITRGELALDNVSVGVIDEADRMLDMGFQEDLDFILDALPEERQTMMFSATLDGPVADLASEKLKDPVDVDVSGHDAVTGLTRQYFVKCMRQEKKDLLRVLVSRGTPKVIVFVATKVYVDEIYHEMKDDGLKVGTLHGDMPQDLREKVIGLFRDNRITILLATDVAARGLDISDVDMVVNYDIPFDAETYVHRIGRTGRAGKEGIAVSFVTTRDMRFLPDYEEATGVSAEFIEPTEMEPIIADHPVVERKKREPRRKEGSRKSPAGKRGPKAKADRNAPLYDTTTIEISLGKADGFKRVEIANIVRKRARLDDGAVGKVGLSENSSFVEVPSDMAEYIIGELDGCTVEGRKITARAAPRKTKMGDRKEE
ncbi:MAG: DEAD/DEAH box helicase [Thermoplasmata archaeon]|nr:DEAD/DEAH box helicase [Thermoplasmata archaeon]